MIAAASMLLLFGVPHRAAALICGDGQLDPLEECDDGNLLPGDCCSPLCTFELAGTCAVRRRGRAIRPRRAPGRQAPARTI
jgi:cysteine-rich repeat protein